jgi:hypothetical protein
VSDGYLGRWSEKDEAEDEANVVVGLVATVASDAKSGINSEDENEICLRGKEKQRSWYLDNGCS